jgi:hypothetical protein
MSVKPELLAEWNKVWGRIPFEEKAIVFGGLVGLMALTYCLYFLTLKTK